MSDNDVPELDLVVGSMITTRPDEDREEYEDEAESVSAVQDQLREQGIDIDLLAQPGTEVWEGNIDSVGSLYHLNRLIARLEQGLPIDEALAEGPVLPLSDDDIDSALADIWHELRTPRFPHLLNLQGMNSYFLPSEFEQPLWLPIEIEGEEEEDYIYFGSTPMLQRELTEVEALLNQAGLNGKIAAAARVINTLREASSASLNYSLPLIVW